MRTFFGFLAFLTATPSFAWTLASAVGTQRGWESPVVSFDVNYAQCGITDDQLNTAIDAAAALLSSVPTSNLVVRRGVSKPLTVTDSTPPVIWCDSAFTPSSNFVSGKGSFPGTVNGYITSGMIILNSNPSGAARISELIAVSPDRLALLIAHEMGHVLGLGHSSFEPSLMHYSIGSKDELTLSQDDIDGITFLYPRDEMGDIYGCASLQQVGNRPPSDPFNGLMTTTLWFFVFAAITLVMRKPNGPLASQKLRQPHHRPLHS